MKIPQLGFGTFRLEGQLAYESVKTALATGYRHIDTAQAYGNEAEVGQAIVDSGLSREQVFLTTKVWNDNLSADLFIPSVKQSLTKLATDYVDLLLIHWPCPPKGSDLKQALVLLQQAKRQGLAREIGISNFTIEQTQLALNTLEPGELLTNQIEVHPYLQNRNLVAFCQQNAVKVTAYMPFAVGKVLKDETILAIAKQHKASPAEVVIAWLKQLDLLTIPSSTKAENMKLNMAGLAIQLSDKELNQIAELERNDRQAAPDFSPQWDS